MIITAALCWWNESPELLRECIAGIAQVADRVIALDGAFARYPGATIRSDPNQAAAIRSACEDAGLECLILEPDRLWAGQVEKRTYLLTIAAVGSDWLVIVDSDHIISADRACIRDELARTRYDVLDVPMYTPANPDRPLLECAPSQWHIEQIDGPKWHPLIVRAFPGLMVERHHWWISALVRGQRVWLWPGEDDGRPTLPSDRVRSPYRIEHRCMFRSVEQVRAERAYENDRELVVLQARDHEDGTPDLPEPIWDCDRIPM